MSARSCSALTAVAATGFASTVAQIVILRELLVLFYGNELSTGLVFSSWLLWTALGSAVAGWDRLRKTQHGGALYIGLLLLALLLPATLLWIRAARLLWAVPVGEMVSPGLMLGIALTSTSGICLLSGFLFTLAWRVYVSDAAAIRAGPTTIYLTEAAGATAGGLLFYFVFLGHLSTFHGLLAVAFLLLVVVMVLLKPWTWRFARESAAAWLQVLAVGCLAALLWSLWSGGLDRTSRRWQWGKQLLAVQDSPYQNLALLRNANQLSLFGNGLWLFSVPDPQSAEQDVHFALLTHPHPRKVLLIGGGVAGLIREILKHPQVERLDYVEADPEILRLATRYFPGRFLTALRDPRVNIFHEDAGSFLRRHFGTYDVVLMNVGEPINAAQNRFYTVEFFHQVKRLLNPGGIFCFAVGSSAASVGPTQAQFLRSLDVTLHQVFPGVLVLPGPNARFLASDRQSNLVSDPQLLADRIAARGLRLRYVREYYLFDYLNPMPIAHLRTILEAGPHLRANSDFAPTCYFNNLLLWANQLHSGLQRTLTGLAEIRQGWFWGGLLLVVCGYLFLIRTLGPSRRWAVPCGVSVLVVGASQMVLEIILLLGFQVLEGFVYRQLALIIAFFMAGMASGAGLEAWLAPVMTRPRRWLMGIQICFALYLVLILQTLLWLHGGNPLGAHAGGVFPLPVGLLFSGLALLAGILGGAHFALAVRVVAGSQVASSRIGGGLYALDLLGAASGALTAALVLLPVFGLLNSLAAISLVSFGTSLALAGPEPQT